MASQALKLKDILDTLLQAEREAIAARTKELLAEEISLRDLHRAQGPRIDKIDELSGC